MAIIIAIMAIGIAMMAMIYCHYYCHNGHFIMAIMASIIAI